MDKWTEKLNLCKQVNPLWQAYFHKHFGSLLLNVKSLEDDLEIQLSKQGDFLILLDLDDGAKNYFVECKVQTEKYFHRQERDYSKVLFEDTGNVEAGKMGSSFFHTKADLYAFSYLLKGQLVLTNIFYVRETQSWLLHRIMNNPGLYPIIHTDPESNDGLYTTAFRLVPLKHIPGHCIVPRVSS